MFARAFGIHSPFHRQLIWEMSTILQANEETVPFVWNVECQKISDDIKKNLTNLAVLIAPISSK